MKYLARTFTLPSSGNRTPQLHWDLAFLSRDEFIAKHGMTPEEYTSGVQKAQ